MSFATAKVGGSSAGGFAQYLSEQAELVADYYGSRELDGMAFTRVQGKAAGDLGVEQGLTMEQFEDLHHGRWNGRQLSQVSYRPVWETDAQGRFSRDARGHKIPARDAEGKMRTTPYRNAWVDAVWAAPKSVSEYMIATDDRTRKRIIAAWDASCAEGIKAIEDRAYLLRRTISKTYVDGSLQQGSATERVRGAHLIVVPATQLAARHTEETIARGTPPDPHLHTHNAIATLAFLPDPTHPDGLRPLTVDELGLKKFGEEANAIVMGDFARRLEEIGIELDYEKFSESRRGTIGWEVAGISEEARLFHSTNSTRRNAIIKKWEHDFGRPPTAPELSEELRKTRVSKKQDGIDKEADSKGVWDIWRQNLRDAGIREPFLQPREQNRESEAERRIELRRRLMGTNGLVRDNADFTGDTIMNAVERSAVGLGFTQEVLKSIESEVRSELIVTREANDDRYTYFTTKAQVDKETRLERGRRFIAKRDAAAPSKEILTKILDSQKITLDPQQREAVIAAASKSWAHIEGHAGAGKTTAVTAVKEALEEAKLVDQTVVVSTAAATAQRSGRKIGTDRSGAVEGIQRQVEQGHLVPTDRTLWIIDEAAMMDTNGIDNLLMAARGQGRFLFVGDPAQLSPIGPAGWYAESVSENGATMLDKTHRFKDPQDVRDYALLRTGDINHTRRSIENLATRGRVHVSDDRTDRVIEAFEHYKKIRDDRPELTADDIRVIIETNNQDVDSANRFIQSDRKARKELDGDGFEVHDDEQGRMWSLHDNDSVIFLRAQSVGRGEEPIKNGTKGQILDIDKKTKRARLLLEDDREVTVPLKEHQKKQPIGLAYSQHVNKIQGDEVKVVQVMPGTEHTANANSAYSQLTRAKEEAHVYLDRDTHGDEPEEALAQSWSKRVEKRTSLSRLRERDLMNTHTEPEHEQTAEERKPMDLNQELRRRPGKEHQVTEREAEPSAVAVEDPEEEKQQTQPQRKILLRERLPRRFGRKDHEQQEDKEQSTESPVSSRIQHLRERNAYQSKGRDNDIGR